MRRIALAAGALLVALATQASAATIKGPTVEVMVVGKSRVLHGPAAVRASPVSIRLGRRNCAVGAGTPLAALAGLRRARGPTFHLRDYGSCSRRPADAEGLFVFQIGPDRNRGSDGWVYKVNRIAPSIGAGSPSGRRLRSHDRVTWFYCRTSRGGTCQGTLEVTLGSARVGAGGSVRALVRGYDDFGRGKAIAGATVSLADASAATGADGVATLSAPAAPGRYVVTAQAAGLVPSYPAGVTVG